MCSTVDNYSMLGRYKVLQTKANLQTNCREKYPYVSIGLAKIFINIYYYISIYIILSNLQRLWPIYHFSLLKYLTFFASQSTQALKTHQTHRLINEALATKFYLSHIQTKAIII
jgi:hypothetical protein